MRGRGERAGGGGGGGSPKNLTSSRNRGLGNPKMDDVICEPSLGYIPVPKLGLILEDITVFGVFYFLSVYHGL